MFQSCIQGNQANTQVVLMKKYVEAYTKLTKTFGQFGLVLRLANEDILSKLGFLDRLHTADPVTYNTFQSMFRYEFSTGIVQNRSRDSGVRENRIIHRGLHLFYEVLRDLSCRGDNCQSSMSSRMRYHYDKILSPYHTFWIRNAARVALLSFPSRGSMLDILGVAGDPGQVAHLTKAVGKVYRGIEYLYKGYPVIE